MFHINKSSNPETIPCKGVCKYGNTTFRRSKCIQFSNTCVVDCVLTSLFIIMAQSPAIIGMLEKICGVLDQVDTKTHLIGSTQMLIYMMSEYSKGNFGSVHCFWSQMMFSGQEMFPNTFKELFRSFSAKHVDFYTSINECIESLSKMIPHMFGLLFSRSDSCCGALCPRHNKLDILQFTLSTEHMTMPFIEDIENISEYEILHSQKVFPLQDILNSWHSAREYQCDMVVPMSNQGDMTYDEDVLKDLGLYIMTLDELIDVESSCEPIRLLLLCV